MRMTVICPDCGQAVDVPDGAKPGDRFECPFCAGTWLRWEGEDRVSRVYTVSCPVCGEDLEVPADAKPGDILTACGRPWRLTFAYGAYALEPLTR
jgi:rRNA maturation protein Nop10